MMEGKIYQHWFLSSSVISGIKKTRLIDYFGDAYHIYFASETDIKLSGILDNDQLRRFLEERGRYKLDYEYEKFTHSPFSFITIEDSSFPEHLKNIYNPPYGLFYLGHLPQTKKSAAIVGARICSEYGKRMAFDLSQALSDAGYTVISGMARGIDTYAHSGCLKGQSDTIAVLGGGCDIVYPKENRLLYEQISKRGAIVSEFAMSTQPQARFFPQRNRLVSGMAQLVVVVEAKAKSGSLITADFALEQGRDIYACPGRVSDKLSEGCNSLITQGAGIIVSVEQFMRELSEFNNDDYVAIKRKDESPVKLDKKQLAVLSLFDEYPKSLSEVESIAGIDYLELITVVMSLVKEGLLFEIFKNHFVISGQV